MTKALRPISLLLFALLANGASVMWCQVSRSSDSLQVSGRVLPAADSVLAEVSLHLEIAGRQLQPGDSMDIRLPRSARLLVWGESPLGRLQFEVPLPPRVDSTAFALLHDSTGTLLCWPDDTLQTPWTPKTNGCFPATSAQSVEHILAEVTSISFESARLDALSRWMMDQCLSTGQIERLTAVFDDEARRLRLIQRAPCTTPSKMKRLEKVFTSAYYRGEFLEWAEQLP